VRVGIAEDVPLFLEVLQMQLERIGVEVVITAGNGDELLAQAARHPIDAAILDVCLPPTYTDEGLRAAERLSASHPRMGILLLSQYAEIAFATRLFANGSSYRGYLLKQHVGNAETLRDAVDRVCSGESVVDHELIGNLVAHQRHLRKLDRLSTREQEILALMAEGRSNQGMAKAVNLGEKAVEANIARIYAKLDLIQTDEDNRRVLAVLAWLRGS
jgi:DNA-binding NarL/FixJ family response regulator